MPDTALWDGRARLPGLHAVLSTRWSDHECRSADRLAADLVTDRAFGGGRRADRLLDLGCGIGRLTRALARRAAFVVGVDASAGMVARAGRENDRANARFVRASATALPFPGGSFDCVVAAWILQHVIEDADHERTGAEIRRLLAPGGRLVLLDGNVDDAVPRVPSTHTKPRRIEEHRAAFGPGLVLARVDPVTFVSDAYQLSVWERTAS